MIEDKNISVIMRVYNSERFIKEALESVFKQNFLGTIYLTILYDEGTTDSSLEILQNLISNEKIRLNIIKHPHTTASLAILEAEKIDKLSDYYCFLDCDNRYAENYLSEAIQYMRSNKIDFLFSPLYVFNKNGTVMESILNRIPKFPKYKILASNFVDMNTIILSKVAFFYIVEKLHKINKQFFYWFHEDWVIGALAIYNFKYGMLESAYVYYRWHENNINFRSNDREASAIKTLNTRLLMAKLIFSNLSVLGILYLYLHIIEDITYLFLLFLRHKE